MFERVFSFLYIACLAEETPKGIKRSDNHVAVVRHEVEREDYKNVFTNEKPVFCIVGQRMSYLATIAGITGDGKCLSEHSLAACT